MARASSTGRGDGDVVGDSGSGSGELVDTGMCTAEAGASSADANKETLLCRANAGAGCARMQAAVLLSSLICNGKEKSKKLLCDAHNTQEEVNLRKTPV